MKTIMNTFAQRGIRAWVLVGLLGCCGWAVAQTMPEPRTSDGRAFSTLSEAEVDGLTRPEKKAYYAWKNAALDTQLQKLEEDNARKHVELAEIESKTSRVTTDIEQMMATVMPQILQSARQGKLVLNDQGKEGKTVLDAIKAIASGRIPLPQHQGMAREILRYYEK